MFRSAHVRARFHLSSPAASQASLSFRLRAAPRVHASGFANGTICGNKLRSLRPPMGPAASPATTRQLFTSSRLLLDERQRKQEMKKEEERLRMQKLESDPEHVTTRSSVREIFEPSPATERAQNYKDDEPEMLAGVKSDLKTVRETFALGDVPKEVIRFGGLGLVPYVATSFSTLFLAWDMNYAVAHGTGVMVSAETAEHLLHVLEPVQIGLGAIILSFLGAVHWGLEMAEYGGKHPFRRYTIGILAPMLAWPTVLLPLDYALLVQFAGFTGMYFADAQATTWGWAPRWYTTYRFILTFIVGASIVMTLIGRGQIGDSITPTQGAGKHLKAIKDSSWDNLQKEEDERKRRLREEKSSKKEDDNDNDNDNDDSGDDGDKKGGQENATDPGKRAAAGQPGTQGTYSDDKQGGTGQKPNTPTPGQPTDPTPEKKGAQKSEPEKKSNTGTKG